MKKQKTDPNQIELNFDIVIEDLFLAGNLQNIRTMLPSLYSHQHEDVMKAEQRFLNDGKGYLFTNGTGTGKAQPLDSKIATPKGFVNMGSLKVGDKVIGYNGKPKNITGVFPQGAKEVYDVFFQDGSSTRCCKEHLWETQTLNERRGMNKHLKNKTSKNFKNRVNTFDKWKPKVRSLENIIKTIDERHFIPIVKPVNYSKKKFRIDPYLMGMLLGDGCLKYSSYTITTDDSEILDYCKLTNGDYFVKKNQKNKTPSYKIKGKGLRNKKGHPIGSVVQQEFVRLKLDNTDSLNKFIPKKYLLGNINQRLELLRGLMDSDGTVNKGLPSYCSISIELANGVAELVRSLGGTASVNKKEMHEYHDAYIVHINIGNKFNPFKLKRKADLFKPSSKYFPKKVITKIEKVGLLQCQCISIDCERSLYATDDYILTHNTFVGLGIAKRFYIQDKTNVLIVVPTERKATDWVNDGFKIGLDIYKIKDTNDKGVEVSVTTYANFYNNDAINLREWDLVIYDESHYLNQNAKGTETVYLNKHKKIANLPSQAFEKARDLAGLYPDDYNHKDYSLLLKKWKAKRIFEAEKIVKKTKVVFLSATPFAYHKSIEYADGCLFEINEKIEKEETSFAYNEAHGFGAFLQENFGYRMKYNKVTIPETGVDQNLLERNFFETHAEKGVMSTRVLDLDFDYSRDFITVQTGLGEFINEGMELFYSKYIQDKYKYLSRFATRKYNYLFVNQLLECIKAQEAHSRIKKHLALGRKVVVFHSYNNSTIRHPFHFEAEDLIKIDEHHYIPKLEQEIRMFNVEFPQYVELDLSHLENSRKAITKHFPQAKEFNGTVSKKKRSESIDDFNTDYSLTDILVVQTKAGREGISLHDTTGAQQRVLINLGLPTAPTEAIQTEGRIYRAGLKSNAIYEYLTVQTNFERNAFAEKIAQRSKTAENLAMGNLARDLEIAFKEGYINSFEMEPSLEQGFGGKEKDRFIQQITEFEKAKTYYWSRGKKTAKNKAKEGVDYFATPEPLGYMMLKWLNPQPDERGLEPSAGHGAIARWFPNYTLNRFVEPSYQLSSELKINSHGEVINSRYEDHYFGNKYEFIAMNPPFGIRGQTAMSHIEKAVKQMHWRNSRLIAIVPQGSSMDKRLEEFYNSKDFEDFRHTGEILLPACLFERAGTNVFCKIIRIERANEQNQFKHNKVDLTGCENINEFFDTIEGLEF